MTFLSLQEFIQLYKIILPKGLLSSKEDVATFLESMNLNKDNYQIGITKVNGDYSITSIMLRSVQKFVILLNYNINIKLKFFI